MSSVSDIKLIRTDFFLTNQENYIIPVSKIVQVFFLEPSSQNTRTYQKASEVTRKAGGVKGSRSLMTTIYKITKKLQASKKQVGTSSIYTVA